MAGLGRGNLTSTFQNISFETTSCSEENVTAIRDSGLGTNTTTTDSSISNQLKQLSIGIGRGQALEIFKMTAEASGATAKAPTLGRGKAMLNLKSFNISTSMDSGSDSASKFGGLSTKSEHESTEPEEEPEISRSGDYFKPSSGGTIVGSKGTPVRLVSNYIRLEANKDKGVYVYEVRFCPSVDSINLRVKYLYQHREALGGTVTFDGVMLFLPILLEQKLVNFVSKNVADGTDIEVRILYKKKETIKNCIQLYNILFDRVMKTLNYVRFDRKQFDPTAPKLIPMAKLEVWPGYVTAVDEYDGGLMLCCDVSHRILCQRTVLDMLLEIYQRNPAQFQENAKKSLLGSVVITRYNNRTYRIDNICFDKNPQSTFETKNGDINYMDYYRKQYNITIRDVKQPLLLSFKKQRAGDAAGVGKTEDTIFCLIPELCYLTGLRDNMRSDYKLMKEIATFTRITPEQRMLAVEKLIKNINTTPAAKEILANWGLRLAETPREMTGRRFDEEQILFAKKSFSCGAGADFSKYAVSNQLLDVVSLNNWLLIYCESNATEAQSFLENMQRNSSAFGMLVQKPKIIILKQDRIEAYVRELRENISRQHQIVVFIFPTSREERYSAIKKMCCSEIPIPSQVINAKTLSNKMKNRSIVQKIALQMNCKMGGSLWAVKIPFKNVMICGIDSYHDASQKGNSVSALVASLNSNYTKWYSKAVIQTKKEELVNGLCASFKAALVVYERLNGKLPENVIIYRDGVGDGQLPICVSYEIPQFEAACGNKVKITFIVIQKRINTKYFQLSNNKADNPLPGTVVDTQITRSNMYDFFIVPQSLRQGCVTPTHFVVLRDDGNYGPDIIQRLSYKLCFLYYNWPGTIRIPACCQYAHKMAYLIGQNVQREVADELLTKLFYL